MIAYEETLLIIGEPPCGDCGQHHALSPVAEASCRRARVVAFAAIETCRQISERQRTKALQRARAMP
jgi:hypothetical protein